MVHQLPSSQGAPGIGEWMQSPVAGSHVSAVHTLPSSQFGPAPPMQLPPAQVSPVVQAFASSHGTVLFVWRHPVAASHASFVQGSSSSQFAETPEHSPPKQPSFTVQEFWSSQSVASGAAGSEQSPVAGSHAPAVWHESEALHATGSLEHTPPMQTSGRVHAWPSSHGMVLSVWVQPAVGSQVSSVQGLPSSQDTRQTAAPP
jgi:hypothetical protein